MEAERLEFFRALLKNRLNALLQGHSAELRALTEPQESPDPTTLESHQEAKLRLRDREQVLITKILEALERVDNGDFGDCVVCGDPIGERRLLARPVATHCVDCKTRAEQLERHSRTG